MISKIKNFLKNPRPFETPNSVDRLLEKTVLKIIPQKVKPNHVTIFRYVTIPLVLFFLVSNHNVAALVLFTISVFSDALDGAMARTRNSITEWGKLHDPIADKLLIGGAGIFLITKYIGPLIIMVIIAIELAIVLFAIIRIKSGDKILSALLPAKIKMILQSSALLLLLIYSIIPLALILPIAETLLYFAILFALISLFIYKSM